MKSIDIIPAVLAETEEKLKEAIDKVVGLNNCLHIDYTDGIFVKSKTLDWQLLLDLPVYYSGSELELHIMADEPLEIAREALDRGYAKVILPAEVIGLSQTEAIDDLMDLGQVFLSFNPETPIKKCLELIDLVDGVTLLTVKPGRQGNDFEASVLNKLNDLKRIHFKGQIDLDGGINLETIKQIKDKLIDRLVIGSALATSANPKEIYLKLKEMIQWV